MAYYHECPYCQGSLDPGEACDCRKNAQMSATASVSVLTLKQLVELYLQDFISDDEYTEAEKQAKRKLARIIEREGDADGERLKPYYLVQLVAEAVTAERFSNYCNIAHELRTLEKKEMPATKAAGQI